MTNPFNILQSDNVTYTEADRVTDIAQSEDYLFFTHPTLGLTIVNASNFASTPQFFNISNTFSCCDGTGTSSIDVFDTIAYVIDNGGIDLKAFKINDPQDPVLLQSYNISGITKGISLSGTTAYVVTLNSGLQIIDVSNSSAFKLLGNYSAMSDAIAISVFETIAYVINNNGFGLSIIDVNNPASPRLLGGYTFLDYVNGISVSGSIAYLVTQYSLQILDVTYPDTCLLLSAGELDGNKNYRGINVFENTAYLADINDVSPQKSHLH